MISQSQPSKWRLDKDDLYSETVTSNWTHSLLLGFMLLCMFAFVGRIQVRGLDLLSVLLLLLFLLFLFYTLNFRRLQIHITPDALWLKFGLFSWVVPVQNMASAEMDDVPAFLRFGGAGIHYMFVRGRYRVSFNFLEHNRVVVSLRKKAGLVRDVSFSTRQAERVSRILRDLIAEHNPG